MNELLATVTDYQGVKDMSPDAYMNSLPTTLNMEKANETTRAFTIPCHKENSE